MGGYRAVVCGASTWLKNRNVYSMFSKQRSAIIKHIVTEVVTVDPFIKCELTQPKSK